MGKKIASIIISVFGILVIIGIEPTNLLNLI